MDDPGGAGNKTAWYYLPVMFRVERAGTLNFQIYFTGSAFILDDIIYLDRIELYDLDGEMF